MRSLLSSPLLLLSVGVLTGCVVDALVKELSVTLSVSTILVMRYAFGTMLAGGLFWRSDLPWPSMGAIRFHALRGAIQTSAAFSFFFALSIMPLAQATVLGFTATLMVPFLARLILNEKLSGLALGISLLGFAGAALATTDQASASGPAPVIGVIAVLYAAFGYALTLVLLRRQGRSTQSLEMVTFQNAFPFLFSVILAVILLTVRGQSLASLIAPLEAWPLLSLLGAMGLGTWWLFTLAYAREEAQRLAPLEYAALVWSVILGWVFFAEVPGWRTYAGAAMIIAACLTIGFEGLVRNRLKGRDG